MPANPHASRRGPICFASIEAFKHRLDEIEALFGMQSLFILFLRGVGSICLSGADFLIKTTRTARRSGGDVHFVATDRGVLSTLRRTQNMDILREANLQVSKGEAVAQITESADPDMCRTCRLRVFNECAGLSANPKATTEQKPAQSGLSSNLRPALRLPGASWRLQLMITTNARDENGR